MVREQRKGPAHGIEIDAVVADDCPPDRHQEAQSILREFTKCEGITLYADDRKPIASNDGMLMLRYVEVRSLTFKDQYGKRFVLVGRAHDMRPAPETPARSER